MTHYRTNLTLDVHNTMLSYVSCFQQFVYFFIIYKCVYDQSDNKNSRCTEQETKTLFLTFIGMKIEYLLNNIQQLLNSTISILSWCFIFIMLKMLAMGQGGSAQISNSNFGWPTSNWSKCQAIRFLSNEISLQH